MKELERLKELSLTILAFIEETVPKDKWIYLFGRFRDVVIQTYEVQDLRGMRILVGDITALAKDLNKAEVNELNQMLIKKFGDDLNYNRKKIEAILSKEAIKNKSEYRLLFDYFEEIYTDESKKDEINKVREVLEAYQKKKGKV